jgi:hypothetical protein
MDFFPLMEKKMIATKIEIIYYDFEDLEYYE